MIVEVVVGEIDEFDSLVGMVDSGEVGGSETDFRPKIKPVTPNKTPAIITIETKLVV